MKGALAAVPAFAGLTPEDLADLETVVELRTVDDGFAFIEPGEDDPNAEAAFIVLDGRCRVERADGPRRLASFVEPGELFGLIALLDPGPRTASVCADGATTVAVLSRAALDQLRARGDRLTFWLELAVARQIARDFAGMNAAFDDRSSDDADQPSGPDGRAAPPVADEAWETIESYSGLLQARVETARPSDLAGVMRVLDRARRLGRRVTLAGAGLSFDGQAVGLEARLSTERFDDVRVDVERATVTVGAGATWGRILAETSAHGLVPAVVVSGSDITAAGTASTNSLSRFSPVFGKEGRWIRSVEVVLAGGERVVASRDRHADLFYAMIGGFGLVGIISRIEYALLRLGTPVRVQSEVERVPDPAQLAEKLLVSTSDHPATTTAYGLLALKGDEIRGIVTRSRYVVGEPLRTMLPHRPATAARLPIELAIHNVRGAGQRFWNFAYDRYIDESRPYVDELEGYTFFMDGNLRTHRMAQRLDVPFRTVQQTHLIPSGGNDALTPFFFEARDRARTGGLESSLALIDVLHIPAGEPFGLSSSRAGYALTLTFEGLPSLDHVHRARACLRDLARRTREIGGRVHLTKNVFATPDELESMYGEALGRMAAAKRTYDPTGLFSSEWADRLFPRLRVSG